MTTLADRKHTATGLGVRSSNQQRDRMVLTRRACGPRYSIGDSSRALEISRHAAQQQSTPIKCEAAVVIQASAGLTLVSVGPQHGLSSSTLIYFYFLL